MSDNLELTAAITTEEPEVAAALDELRFLVFKGKQGDTGDSAYEEAVQLGFEGTEAEWLASLKGEQGEPGKAKSAYLDYDVVRLVEDDTIYTALMMQTDIGNGVLPLVSYLRESENVEEYFELDQEAISAASPVIHFRSREHLLSVDSTGHFTLTDRPQGGGSADAVLYTPQSLTPAQQAQARGNIGAGTYTKPSGGIPKSDLASAVQTSLGKADTALQTAPVTSVNNKTGAVTLTASDVGALPSSTSIPTAVSELTNDSGYQTASDVQTAVEEIAPFVIPIVETSSGWELDPKSTLTATDIYNGIKQRDGTGSVQIAVVDESSTKYYSVSYFTFYEEGTEDPANTVYAEFSFGIEYQNGKYIDRIVAVQAQPWEDPEFQLTIDEMPNAIGTSLPTVTASDNGKFLRVVNGAWAAQAVPAAESNSF